jgi:hypothetical protein
MKGIRRTTTRIAMAAWLFANSALTADPADTNRTEANEAIFCKGLSLFYNQEYAAASDTFNLYIKLTPEDSRGYWRKFLNDYFRMRYAQGTATPTLNSREYQTFKTLAEMAIAKAATKISRKEDVDLNRYLQASTLSILAVLQFKNESKLKAHGTITEAIRLAEQSSYRDAKFLLGSIYCNAAKHSFTAGMIHFPHNCEKGTAMIFAATAKNNGAFVDDIWFYIFTLEKDNREQYTQVDIDPVWKYLHAKYPRNRMLNDFKQ